MKRGFDESEGRLKVKEVESDKRKFLILETMFVIGGPRVVLQGAKVMRSVVL